MKDLLLLMLYGLSFLVPRNKKIWVFGSRQGHRYNDNSRHLYEYVCKNIPSVRAIWLTRVHQIMEDLRLAGRESYLVNSWQAYWISCRAGLIIASHFKLDVCYYAISRAIKINLWHGGPLKKIGLDFEAVNPPITPKIPFYRIDLKIHKFVSFLQAGKNWDALISTSPIFSKRMSSAFGVDITNVKITGYPRNDILLYPNFKPLPIIDSLKSRLKAKKIVLYAPTWRIDHHDSMKLFDTFDHKVCSELLRNHNTLLLIKLHFMNRETNHNFLLSEDASHIYWLHDKDFPEFNYLLPYTDVLITDYSGAYFDFLLLDRPMIFTPFDLDKYYHSERGMYEDYDEATPGPKCLTWNEVMGQLHEILSGEDKYQKIRKLALKKYHTFVDANSCQRVANIALKLVNGSKLF